MAPPSRYVTHARTLEELRTEFVSDIHRRLAGLDTLYNAVPSASEKAKIARGKIELESLLDYWQSVELKARQLTMRNRGNPAEA